MSLVSAGLSFWPPLIGAGGSNNSGLGVSGITVDSATDRVAYIGRAPATDSIATIHLRTGVVTTGCDIEVRVETVVNGRPSGTLVNAGATATLTVADADDNVYKAATLGTVASLTAGQEFAIVILVASGTPNMQLAVTVAVVMPSIAGAYPILLQDTGAGTWAQPAGGPLNFEWIVEWTTSGILPLPSLSPMDGAALIANFNSGSSPDEKALRFQIPVKRRVIGAALWLMNITAGADFTISVWPAASSTDADAIKQVVVDGDATLAATTDGYYIVFFAPWEPTINTTYYIGVRADTVNNLAIAEAPIPSGITNAIRGFPVVPTGQIYKGSRAWAAGTAGAWTDDANTLPLISLITDQEDDGEGGGGGTTIAGTPMRRGMV